MKAILDRYGIPQLLTTIKTVIPGTATPQIKLGNTMPEQIGLIYGMSVSVGIAGVATVDDMGNTLITLTNASNLFLTLQKGSTKVLDPMRLDKLVYNVPNATVAATADYRYLPMIIPNYISLDTSYYSNPASLTAGEIMLELWYITNEMLDFLVSEQAIASIWANPKGNKM